jgi:hypothetical protein
LLLHIKCSGWGDYIERPIIVQHHQQATILSPVEQSATASSILTLNSPTVEFRIQQWIPESKDKDKSDGEAESSIAW